MRRLVESGTQAEVRPPHSGVQHSQVYLGRSWTVRRMNSQNHGEHWGGVSDFYPLTARCMSHVRRQSWNDRRWEPLSLSTALVLLLPLQASEGRSCEEGQSPSSCVEILACYRETHLFLFYRNITTSICYEERSFSWSLLVEKESPCGRRIRGMPCPYERVERCLRNNF